MVVVVVVVVVVVWWWCEGCAMNTTTMKGATTTTAMTTTVEARVATSLGGRGTIVVGGRQRPPHPRDPTYAPTEGTASRSSRARAKTSGR